MTSQPPTITPSTTTPVDWVAAFTHAVRERFVVEATEQSAVHARATGLASELGLRFVHRASIVAKDLALELMTEHADETLFTFGVDHAEPHLIAEVLRFGDDLVYSAGKSQRNLDVIAFSASQASARATIAHIAGIVIDDDHANDTTTARFSFLTCEPHTRAASWRIRDLSVPTMESVLPGHVPEVAAKLRAIAEAGPDQHGIHIWHGEPGCGKTTAIRALIQSWRDQVTGEVILDPEVFFSTPSYMMSVLSNAAPSRTSHIGYRETTDARRVFILEDAGELIGIDARRETGQGLARLLNLTDGLFGQGEEPLFIITTNEPLTKLHPAILRAGRCRSVIEFRPLDRAAANAWLAEQGAAETVDGPSAIAELAALKDGAGAAGIRSNRAYRALGFGG